MDFTPVINTCYLFPNEHFVDLTLYQYGWEQCRPGHSFGPAARNHYLFHYIIKGKGILHSTDSSGKTTIYHLGPDTGFFFIPQQINTYIADYEDPWEYVWIETDGLKARELFELADLNMNHPVYHPLTLELGRTLMKEMMHLVEHPKESPFYLIGHLYLFFDCLHSSGTIRRQQKGGRLKDYYAREAISFIEQHYQEDIRVEDIAAWCNLDRSYFGKIFHEAISQSPQDFLIHYRLIKALELLKNTSLPIHEVGKEVGYPNQLHFSRIFKRKYGVSPTQWRNSI